MSGDGWVSCDVEMPDADLMVMTYSPESCEPVWPASFDGVEWVNDYGGPVGPRVTHWRQFPDPPGEVRHG
jgi:hypothetical protein